MILVDTNVIIDVRDRQSPFHKWAEETLADALSTEGAALNAVILAELCVGHDQPAAIEDELRAREHGWLSRWAVGPAEDPARNG